MRSALACLVAVLAGVAAAAEPTWDYLPTVGYTGDALTFALRCGADADADADAGGWSARAPSGPLGLTVRAGSVEASFAPAARDDRVEFTRGERSAVVRLARPGACAGLAIDARWRLRLNGAPAVLILDRIEAVADRRWKMFRALSRSETMRCDLLIEAPAVPDGESGLLAEICAAQRQDLEGRDVLVLLPGSDRLAGWKHREYRQAVAWLVSDALARGAAHVALAGPVAPRADAALLAPLSATVAEVATAYHTRLVDLSALCDDAYWTIAPGFIGPGFNQQGKAALAAALAPWRK